MPGSPGDMPPMPGPPWGHAPHAWAPLGTCPPCLGPPGDMPHHASAPLGTCPTMPRPPWGHAPPCLAPRGTCPPCLGPPGDMPGDNPWTTSVSKAFVEHLHYIPMENVFTSADVIQDHSDLVFADFREGHMTTIVDTKTFRYQCTQKFVPWSKVH